MRHSRGIPTVNRRSVPEGIRRFLARGRSALAYGWEGEGAQAPRKAANASDPSSPLTFGRAS